MVKGQQLRILDERGTGFGSILVYPYDQDPLYDVLGGPDARRLSWNGTARSLLVGLPALIRGVAGNFVSIQIAEQPIQVDTLNFVLVNPYVLRENNEVTNFIAAEVSDDGASWQRLSGIPSTVSGLETPISLPINRRIDLIRFVQGGTGISMGITGIEVVQPRQWGMLLGLSALVGALLLLGRRRK